MDGSSKGQVLDGDNNDAVGVSFPGDVEEMT